jgi:hypothetical protein
MSELRTGDQWCPGCGSTDFDPHTHHDDDCGGIEDLMCMCEGSICGSCCPECKTNLESDDYPLPAQEQVLVWVGVVEWDDGLNPDICVGVSEEFVTQRIAKFLQESDADQFPDGWPESSDNAVDWLDALREMTCVPWVTIRECLVQS